MTTKQSGKFIIPNIATSNPYYSFYPTFGIPGHQGLTPMQKKLSNAETQTFVEEPMEESVQSTDDNVEEEATATPQGRLKMAEEQHYVLPFTYGPPLSEDLPMPTELLD